MTTPDTYDWETTPEQFPESARDMIAIMTACIAEIADGRPAAANGIGVAVPELDMIGPALNLIKFSVETLDLPEGHRDDLMHAHIGIRKLGGLVEQLLGSVLARMQMDLEDFDVPRSDWSKHWQNAVTQMTDSLNKEDE